MADGLAEIAAEAIGATVEILTHAEPRRRRWKIARIIVLTLIFGAIIGVPIAFLLF